MSDHERDSNKTITKLHLTDFGDGAPFDETCPLCGQTLDNTESSQDRNRIILQDEMEGGVATESATLCSSCWGRLYGSLIRGPPCLKHAEERGEL